MHTKKKLALALLVASAALPGLPAQTKTPPVASAPPAEEDTIVLSPFEVSAEKDNGYQATSTLAGTRIRTELKDVGASIQVLTKQFLDDVGATDNQSLLQYTTNTEVSGSRGTYGGMGNGTSVNESSNLIAPQSAQRVRGLAAADVARDYYISDIPWDSFNVDRIDVLRGPNSILYGLGSPAGIINASTHNAEFKNMGNFQNRFGSYGSVRNSLDVNQVLIPKVLSIRLDGLLSNKKYEQDPAFENDKRLFGAIRFDPQFFNREDFHTSIKAKFEAGQIYSNHPRTVPPMDSVSPWFNPTTISSSNPFGGLGKAVVNTVYDPSRTDNLVAGNGYGASNSSTINYLPWLAGAQVQQPFYFIDGASNSLSQAFGGFINNGVRDSNGNVLPISSGISGLRQFVPFYSVQSLSQAVVNAHNANAANFPDAGYGQYRANSLLDPSIFNFYKYLLDGPNKREYDNWTARNIDLQQTAFDDRLGIDLTYDYQRDRKGGWSLLSYQPTISIDITKNGEEYYTHPSTTGITNPNFGRPFVYGAGGSGGSEYVYERKYLRASLFGEFRPSDVTSNSFLLKLLGKQRFNAVTADEKYYNETKTYQLYANSTAWQGYWNANDGSTYLWSDRSPQAVIYLGPSVVNAASASGLNIPNIKTTITLPDTGVRVFDTTWQNYGVKFSDPWSVPSSLYSVFNGAPNQDTTKNPAVTAAQLYQSSNPANYKGWTNVEDDLQRYNNGANQSLLTGASKLLRETISDAATYQGYFWNNAVVATLGWRYDEVRTKSIIASKNAADRQTLNVDSNTYKLPDQFPANSYVKGHSTSGGVVLHLNQVLGSHDFLPINIGVSYNESSNFQVTSLRTDIYGNPIGNPSGKTYEYGLTLSTKDDKVTLRVAKYTTRLTSATSSLDSSSTLGSVIASGLTWRNIYLYQLGGYDWTTRNQPSYRNSWTNAFPLGNTKANLLGKTNYTQAQADADEDSALDTWNDIQKTLDAKGFFKAWNFTPTTQSVLVNRTTYAANPAQYAPDPSSIANYSAGSTSFAVTADTESKGYEFELIANPTKNWRISFNAAQTTATEKNVGGPNLVDYVNYLNSKLINSDGTLTPAGALPRFGAVSSSIYPSIWGPFLAKYTLLQLNEGSAAPEWRKWRYNIITNYSFNRGWFKGVGVGGAYHWQDKVVLGYPVVSGSSFANYDLSKPFYGPAIDGIDLWASYERKVTSKINWRIQLNVYNVGKTDKLIPISVEPDGHTWASARVQPVQEWQLTNSFTF